MKKIFLITVIGFLIKSMNLYAVTYNFDLIDSYPSLSFYNNYSGPGALAINSNGNLLVHSGNTSANWRINTFDFDFNLISSVNGYANYGMQVDSNGRIILTHSNFHGYNPPQGMHQVIILNSDLSFNSSFGSTAGNDATHLSSPSGLDIDQNGNIYIADTTNDRIVKLDSNLNFVAQYSIDEPVTIAINGNRLYTVTNVIVGGQYYPEIVELDLSLNPTGLFSILPDSVLIRHLEVDNNGALFAVTSLYGAPFPYIELIKLDNNLQKEFEFEHSFFNTLLEIEFDSQGYLYASDFYNGLAKFQITKTNATIPEPTTLFLMGIGLGALGLSVRRNKK